MFENLVDTFDDLSIDNKRNLVFNLLMKMDLLLEEVNSDNQLHREVDGYVYNHEDEDEYLTNLYKNLYNLTENLVDFIYVYNNKKSN